MIAVAMLIANAANYGFQILTSRFLSVSEYGLLGSFMSAIAVITVSASALQTTAARAVSQGLNEPGIGLRHDRLIRSALLTGLGVGGFILLGSPLEMRFFDVGLLPIVALATFVLPAVVDSIAGGRLQGSRRFGALGVYSAGQAVAKLGVATLALLAGMSVGGVLMATAVGAAVVATLGLLASRDLGVLRIHALGRDGRLGFGAFTLLWIALSADVVLARAYFEPSLAGIYVAAAVLGKAVLWLPMIVNQVLFPRLANSDPDAPHDTSADTTLRNALGAVVGVAAVGVVGLAVVGGVAFDLLYGDRYGAAASSAWRIGLAMVPMAVANLLLYDFLARSDSRFIRWLAAIVVAECVALQLVPKTPTAYATVLGLTGCAIATALLLLRFRSTARRAESHVDDSQVVVP